MAAVLLLWALVNLPFGVEYASQESFLGQIGSAIAPLKPSGGMIVSVLVIGWDRLEYIPTQLTGIGFTEIKHITGRKKGHLTMDIPYQVDVVLVLTDYINHGLALKIKEKTREIMSKLFLPAEPGLTLPAC